MPPQTLNSKQNPSFDTKKRKKEKIVILQTIVEHKK